MQRNAHHPRDHKHETNKDFVSISDGTGLWYEHNIMHNNKFNFICQVCSSSLSRLECAASQGIMAMELEDRICIQRSCHTLGCIFDALFIFYRFEPEKFWKQNGIEYNAITGVIICTKKFFLKTISLYHNSVSSKQNT